MQKALIENKPDFVQLFLDSGVKFDNYLTVGRLEDLYKGVSPEKLFLNIESYSLILNMYFKVKLTQTSKLFILSHVIRLQMLH